MFIERTQVIHFTVRHSLAVIRSMADQLHNVLGTAVTTTPIDNALDKELLVAVGSDNRTGLVLSTTREKFVICGDEGTEQGIMQSRECVHAFAQIKSVNVRDYPTV